MKNKQKFEKFLESLKGKDQDALIESIKTGFKACLENETALTGHFITSTYETYTEESVEHGDAEDRVWLDEEGESMEPDEYDIEDGLSVIDKTVKFLQSKGAIHPNDSMNARWWSTEEEMDMHTGERMIKSYHLNNYTEEEKAEINKRMGRR